jgi:hypothetical protein
VKNVASRLKAAIPALASANTVPPCIKNVEIEMGLDIDPKRIAKRKRSDPGTSITRIITRKNTIIDSLTSAA